MAQVTATLRRAAIGTETTRLRSTWRVLLAVPLLPLVGLLAARVQAAIGLRGMVTGGPVQGVIFLVLLVAWSALVDRRPISDYGVTASRRWVADLGVALLAGLAVWTAWHGLAANLGWFDLAAGPALDGDEVAGVVGVFASLAINTWVQDVVFFAIVLAVAAEGFHARGVGRHRAVLGGWLVGVLFFTAIHGTPTVIDAASTALGAAVFGLLYVHTGDLAATIGVHWASSFAAGTMFADPERSRAVVHVTGTVPGVDAMAPALVLYPVTYLLVVGWLRISRGHVGVDPGLATWTERTDGLLGTRGE